MSRNVTFLGLTENQSSAPKCSEANLSYQPSPAEHLAATPLDDDLTDLEECTEVITEQPNEEASDSGERRNEVSDTRRYPMRDRRSPQPYWYANICLTDPTTIEGAFSSDQHEDWKLALHEEV